MDSNILINNLNEKLEPQFGVMLNDLVDNFSVPIIPVSGQQIGKIGEIISGEIPMINSSGLSVFTQGNQFIFDSILNNNFDVISTNVLFEKVKDYEQKYKETSENFYKNWIKGEVITTPEIHNWMNSYRILFNPSNK